MLRRTTLRAWAGAAALLALGCGNEVVIASTGVGGGPSASASIAGTTTGSGTSIVASSNGAGGASLCGPDGAPCDDGLACTVGEHCVSHECAEGDLVQCPPPPGGGECLVATCDEASGGCVLVPGNDGLACFNVGPCQENGVCAGGKCEGAPVDCSALDGACTKGACDPMVAACVAVPSPSGAPCDDGNPCTTGTTCNGGTCGGGTSGTTVFFSEDFHDNSKGWTLGTEWQIGPAIASPPTSPFGPDPALDHSPSADNGIAGVVIGGNASTAIHPFHYITSPAFSAIGPTVMLRYHRWLNTDYTPWMTNTIEVWNGAAWENAFITGGPPGVQDGAWTLHELDLSAHANGAMRIRFGVSVGQSGAFTVSSWNIDDVRVTSDLCP